MMFEEVIRYIAEHMEIEIDQSTEFGPVECIKVKLKICDHVISESSCVLQEKG